MGESASGVAPGASGAGAVEVRRAVAADVAAVRDLATRFATSFEVDPAAFDATFHRILGREHCRLLVADVDGAVAGYALVFDHPTFYANGPVGWVEELMVDDGARSVGVGRALMEAAERWAEAQGSALVGLATRRAGPFYAAVGYEESATFYRKLL